MIIKCLATFSAFAMAVVMTACTVHQSDSAPPLTGPSGFAQSISITSNPDRLTQDGQSQSAITVRVFDATGSPSTGVPIRLDMLVDGAVVDFGTLSARNVVSGPDGRATAVYTAAPAPPPASQVSNTVTIRAVAVGTNAQAENPFSTDIRLVPPGVILPPAGTPTASFTVSPTPAGSNVPVNFDASPSLPGTNATLVSYRWTFGDGSSASGRAVSKTFTTIGTFNVTLTVTNDRGIAASTTQAVTVGTTTLPTAAFTYSPAAPAVNQTVNFNAAASAAAPGRSIASYAWDFGDGSAAKTGVTAQHDFGVAGTYTVTLVVTDDVGQRSTAAQSVTAASSGGGTPGPPTAFFVYSPTGPQVDQAVNFNAEASRAGSGRTIVSYSWNFGDGSTITLATATTTHSFTVAGTYNVTLTVADDAGQRSTAAQSVTVVVAGGGPTPAPPTASFVFSPTAPQTGQTVNFNAGASQAAAGRTIVSYSWNFGDGAVVTLPTATTTHIFDVAGTYNVTLTVADDIGQRNTAAPQPVAVTGSGTSGAPVAAFVFSPTSPQVNQSVNFNADASRAAPGRTIANYSWNFGDGSTGNGVTSTTTHVFATPATYNVSLTVTDDIGQRGTATQSVAVVASPLTLPTASFTYSPAQPGIGESVFFNGSGSTPGLGHTITSYNWTFGDGATASGVTAIHQYATAGTYSAQLRVTDEAGQSSTSTQTSILVGNPPAPTSSFTYSPTSPAVGQQVVFDASTSTTAQGQTIADVAWNFGDGTPVVHCPGDPTCTSTNRISVHTYTFTGTFIVNLVVTDSAGRTGSSFQSITIAGPSPTPVLLLFKSGGNTIQADGSGSTATGGFVIASYRFIWGDGTPDSVGAASSVSHTFAAPGIHTVTLVVTDSAVPPRTGATSKDITTP